MLAPANACLAPGPTSLGRAPANADMELLQSPYPTLLSLFSLACLALKTFYISMDAVSPRLCNDVTCCSLGFPKCAQKAALCTAFCRKTRIAFLVHYTSFYLAHYNTRHNCTDLHLLIGSKSAQFVDFFSSKACPRQNTKNYL